MSSSSYSAVSTSDPDDAASSSSSRSGSAQKRSAVSRTKARTQARTPRFDGETEEAYNRRVTSQHINAMLHSLGWVAAAGLILYYTDLLNVIRFDTRVNQPFLALGFTALFALLMVVAYLAAWVPLTASRPVLDLSTYAPRVVPVGAVAGVSTFIFFTIALWPVWGWVTLPIMIILSFAACLGPNLLPF